MKSKVVARLAVVLGVAAAGSLVLANDPPSATGSTATATNTSTDANGDPDSSNADGTVTMTVSVMIDNLSPNGTQWRDLKIKPPRGKSLPLLKPPSNGKVNVRPGDDPGTPGMNESDTDSDGDVDNDDGTGWSYDQKAEGGGNGIRIFTGTSGSSPGGELDSPGATDDPATPDDDESDSDGDGNADPIPYTFDLTFKKGTKPKNLKSCNWELTESGNKKDKTPIEDDGPAAGVNLPVAHCSVNDDAPVSVVTGVTTSVSVVSEGWLMGHTYTVYTSRSQNLEFTDVLGIGINSEIDPVPAAWGVTFESATGTIDTSGEPLGAGYKIVVPNDPALSGETFYAVLGVENSEGDLLFASSPVEVNITSP